MYTLVCKNCGRTFQAIYLNRWVRKGHSQQRKYCSYICSGIAKRGANFEKSYRRIYVADAKWRHKDEHRLLAELALGAPLPARATVHHWDNNSLNNNPANLVICEDQAYHRLLHARARHIKDAGSMDLKRCGRCKLVKSITAFNKNLQKWDKLNWCCKPCDVLENKYARQKKKERDRMRV